MADRITASDYRKRTRRIVSLPSGGEVEIRKLYGFDFMEAGEIPDAFWDAAKKKDVAAAQAAIASKQGLEERMTRAMVVNAVVGMKIVDRPPAECKEDEVSIDEMDPRDLRAIIAAAQEMNSMTEEAGKSIRRFQKEPGPARDAGRTGEAVREAADGDPEPTA